MPRLLPGLLLALTGAAAYACSTAQVFRLNPGEEPERYRVVCRESSRQCDRKAKEQCDGEYTVVSREMSHPEQEEVADSDLSSTGPSEGYVGWRSELIVVCGRELPKLELKRPPDTAASASAASTASSETSTPPPSAAAPARQMLCVPGVTQACLGPGACSGAQACLRDGSGYGVCDCGTAPTPSAASTAPASSAPAL